MTTHDTPTPPGPDKIKAMLRAVAEGKAESCGAIWAEIKDDPKVAAALNKAENSIIIDTALLRLPVSGPFQMTKIIAEQAHAKFKAGDTLGAISNYSAAVSVGIASMVPIVPLGDGVVEGLRYLGVDLKPSPIHAAYNAVTGMRAACDNLQIEVTKRLVPSVGSAMKTSGAPNPQKKPQELTEDQEEAVANVARRAFLAYEEVEKEGAKRPRLPAHLDIKQSVRGGVQMP